MSIATWSSRVSSLLSCRVREMWLEARWEGEIQMRRKGKEFKSEEGGGKGVRRIKRER